MVFVFISIARNGPSHVWFSFSQCVAPYITAAVPAPSVPALVKAFMHLCNNDIGASDEEEEDGIDLCNCEFSLAYGKLPHRVHCW